MCDLKRNRCIGGLLVWCVDEREGKVIECVLFAPLVVLRCSLFLIHNHL